MSEISEKSSDWKILGVKYRSTRRKTSPGATLSKANHPQTGLSCNTGPSVRSQRLSRSAMAPQAEILKSEMNSEGLEEGRYDEVSYQVKNGQYWYIHVRRQNRNRGRWITEIKIGINPRANAKSKFLASEPKSRQLITPATERNH